jgi:hypothetical protein
MFIRYYLYFKNKLIDNKYFKTEIEYQYYILMKTLEQFSDGILTVLHTYEDPPNSTTHY